MRLSHSLSMLLLGVSTMLLLPHPAHAQTDGAGILVPTISVTTGTAAPVSVLQADAPVSMFGHAADSSMLADQRGGSDLVKNELQLSGVTADNVAHNVSTGTNAIGGGSFAGASGLPIVIQNSGANVLIQNATILNLHLQ